MSKANSVMAMLSVTDMERSLRFYRDVLGGTRLYQFPPEGDPQFLTLEFGQSELGIGLADLQPLHGRKLRPAIGHRMELCFYIDGLDDVVAEAAAIGLDIVLYPTAQPWGERIAYVEDPDGNLVMLVTPVE